MNQPKATVAKATAAKARPRRSTASRAGPRRFRWRRILGWTALVAAVVMVMPLLLTLIYAVEQSRASIDSLYKRAGYYAARVKTLEVSRDSSGIRLVFDVQEGARVAIGQVVVDGNKRFNDKALVKHMATRPEGFWWFQNGEYDERKVDQDVRERLPHWYADNGFVDFQVTHDSLVSDSAAGKAVLHLQVDEGQQYDVGVFDVEGNRRFSSEELQAFYPFGPIRDDGTPLGGTAPTAAPIGKRPRRRCRTSTPTTATSTPRSSPPKYGAPRRTGST